jgi:hypothetical protein
LLLVGKPVSDARAAVAVLKARDDDVAPSIQRVSYDALGVARELRAVGLPEEFAEKLVAAA